MATKKQVLEAALRGEGCLGKAADDEPVFVLRAQDLLSNFAVANWAMQAADKGCPIDKVAEAQLICDQMYAWPNRKYPD